MLDVVAYGADRHARARNQVVQVVVIQVVRDDDDPVHRAADDGLAEQQFLLAHVVRVGNHDVVAMLKGHILHGAHHGVVEGVADVGDHHADHVNSSAAQAAGVLIGMVTQLFNRPPELFAWCLR